MRVGTKSNGWCLYRRKEGRSGHREERRWPHEHEAETAGKQLQDKELLEAKGGRKDPPEHPEVAGPC